MNDIECDHGSLKRVCYVCEIEDRLAEAETTIGALKHLIGEQTDRIAELADSELQWRTAMVDAQMCADRLRVEIAELKRALVWLARRESEWGGADADLIRVVVEKSKGSD
jgi:hypothetical protein